MKVWQTIFLFQTADFQVPLDLRFQAAFYLSVPRKSLETEELTLTVTWSWIFFSGDLGGG